MFTKIRSKIFGQRLSGGTAKNRLQMVLVQDRSGLSRQELDLFQKDLIEVIAKYFVLERKSIEVEWRRDDSTTALVINTPVLGRMAEKPLAA